MLDITTMPAFILMQVAGIPEGNGFELTIANIVQWIAVAGGVLGLIWGWREKRQAVRQGSQTIEKNTFDHLMSENQKLVDDIRRTRKVADKFWILRDLSMQTVEGRRLVKQAEDEADAVSSDEN